MNPQITFFEDDLYVSVREMDARMILKFRILSTHIKQILLETFDKQWAVVLYTGIHKQI